MLCPLCGYKNTDTATSCSRCGVEFAGKKTNSSNSSQILDYRNKSEYSNSDIMSKVAPALRAMHRECVTYNSLRNKAIALGAMEGDKPSIPKRILGGIQAVLLFILRIPVHLVKLWIAFFEFLWSLLWELVKIVFRIGLYWLAATFILLFCGLFIEEVIGYPISQSSWFLPLQLVILGIVAINAIIASVRNSYFFSDLIDGIAIKHQLKRMSQDDDSESRSGIKGRKEAARKLEEANALKKNSLARIHNFPENLWTPDVLERMASAFEDYKVHSWAEADKLVR